MPTRAATDEEVAAKALVMIGAKPMTSFLDGTTESVAANAIYEDVVTHVMTLTRWRFTVEQARLNMLSTPPEARWEAAYQLPADALAVIGCVDKSDNPVKFERYNNEIYADKHDELYVDYQQRVPTVRWPPYFTLPVIHALAGELAIAVAQNSTLSEQHTEKFNRLLAAGKTADAQGRTNTVLRLKRYETARR